MKREGKFLVVVLMIILMAGVPVAASAHGGFGGGAILGFGLGLFAGLGFAPRPVYTGPVYPSYYVAPPPVAYGYYPAPSTAYPAAYGYTDNTEVVSTGPPPAGQSSCREWSLIQRRWENRWDSYYGRWRPVLVERWGWANIPCGK